MAVLARGLDDYTTKKLIFSHIEEVESGERKVQLERTKGYGEI